MTLTACIVCGDVTARTRCPLHDRDRGKASAGRRGYDYRWQRLSERARRLQPWCSDCGTSDDLTADHLHWPARGLEDVEVVCRSCNSKRGASRGPLARPR